MTEYDDKIIATKHLQNSSEEEYMHMQKQVLIILYKWLL